MNSLSPGEGSFDFNCVIIKHFVLITLKNISIAIALSWMAQQFTVKTARVMTWCRRAARRNPIQYRLRPIAAYDVIWPNTVLHSFHAIRGFW